MKQMRILQIAVISGVILVVIGALSLIVHVLSNRTYLVLQSDTNNTTLQIENSTYTIGKDAKKIKVRPGTYNYRGINTIGATRFTLSDSTEAKQGTTTPIHINFALYTASSVAGALCTYTKQTSDCPFTAKNTVPTFLESNTWAVSNTQNDTLGSAIAVLRVNSGKWSVEGGPGTDLQTGGYYPESVERVLDELQK